MIDLIRNYVIPGALSILPSIMDKPEARAMLIAIAAQESKFQYRRQINGPARGLWQFEQIAIEELKRNPKTTHHFQNALSNLLYNPAMDIYDVWKTIENNDILACALARLNLWKYPKPLPKLGETEYAWDQYNDVWKPGKPHRPVWASNYGLGWDIKVDV